MRELERFLYDSMFYIMVYLPSLLILFLIVYLIIGKRKKELFSHWNTLIDGLSYSTNITYNRIETKLHERKITGVSYKLQNKLTGNIFSVRRMYLVIDWQEFRYEICASPFADSFFVSYWLSIRQSWFKSFIVRIPLLGWVISKLFFRVTYYKIDTANMFHSLVQDCIMNVIDEISKEHDIEPLSETQKAPIMKDLFNR